MTRQRPALALLLVIPLLLFMSAEEGHHGSATLDFLGKVVNFVILFGGLTLVLRKPVREMLKKRSAEIEQTLRRTEESKGEAEKKLEACRGRMSGLEEEVRRLKEEAGTEGRAEAERIGRAAAAETERLKKYVRQEIEEIARGGVRELVSFTAERAASLARERIRAGLTDEARSALVDRSIERLSGLHETSDPR
jgi:F-type H+-transporting ATPase subunit b